MKSKPYVILSPPFKSNSGGIRVLYALRSSLKAAGQRVYLINDKSEFPIDVKRSEAIAVYPEIYPGNPLLTDHVARWVLYTPGALCGGDKVYAPSEKVFVFSEIYLKDVKNEVQGILQQDTMDLDIFKDHGWKRKGACYFIGKGVYNHKKIPIRAFHITRTEPPNRQGVADIFNTCKTFYCFDPATIMMQEAALCGCPTILLAGNEADHAKTQFGMNGVATSLEGIQEAINTMPLVRKSIFKIREKFKKQLAHFIKVTQEE